MPKEEDGHLSVSYNRKLPSDGASGAPGEGNVEGLVGETRCGNDNRPGLVGAVGYGLDPGQDIGREKRRAKMAQIAVVATHAGICRLMRFGMGTMLLAGRMVIVIGRSLLHFVSLMLHDDTLNRRRQRVLAERHDGRQRAVTGKP